MTGLVGLVVAAVSVWFGRAVEVGSGIFMIVPLVG